MRCSNCKDYDALLTCFTCKMCLMCCSCQEIIVAPNVFADVDTDADQKEKLVDILKLVRKQVNSLAYIAPENREMLEYKQKLILDMIDGAIEEYGDDE